MFAVLEVETLFKKIGCDVKHGSLYMYNTTHMDTTHTLYISNIRLGNVYIYCTLKKTMKQFCKGINAQHKILAVTTARRPLKNLSKNLTKLHGTLHQACKLNLSKIIYKAIYSGTILNNLP